MNTKIITKLPFFYLGMLLTLYIIDGYSQTPEELTRQQNQDVLRDEQRRLKLIERQRLLRELERSLFPIEPEKSVEETPKVVSSDICFDIDTIKIEGADNLYEDEKQAIIADYLNRCLNLNDIDEISKSIDSFYIDNGWIMARSYLQPDQNLKAGILKFTVLEGKLNTIRMGENTWRDKAQIAMAFPDMRDEIVHIRDIEQGLDQMNRLASNNATMALEPVKDKSGYTDIVIVNKFNDRYRLSLGIDNQGSESTGKEKGKLTADIDNLLFINDSWNFSVSDYIGSYENEKDSESYSITMSFPYGYWNYDISSSHSSYLSTVTNPTQAFQTSGESENNSIKVSRIMHRGKISKSTLSVKLSTKASDSFLEDVRLETSSTKFTNFDIGFNQSIRPQTPGKFWNYNINYSRGLDLFDAFEDGPESSNIIPKAQFEKLSWDISTSQPLNSFGKLWSYQGIWGGQVSSDPLFGGEQIAIGNSSTVRGFKETSITGEHGIYFKNDFNRRWQRFPSFTWQVGIDAGYAKAKNNNIQDSEKDSATLAGLTLAVLQNKRWQNQQQLSWSLGVEKSLKEPDFLEEEGVITNFSLNWKWL